MTILEAIILGIVQGLTEFLPVSSSGHLELGSAFLDIQNGDNLTFAIMVHGATALSTIVVFRKDIWQIIKDTLRFKWNESTSMVLNIVISMIPVAIVGLFFEEQIETLFGGRVVLVACMLVITGLLLTSTYLINNQEGKVTPLKAVLIGIAQAFAIMPGISRSGATISTGLLLGVEKSMVTRFSFLMVLPPILGATLLKVKDLLEVGPTEGILPLDVLATGFVSAFAAGVFACNWMIRIVRKGRLIYFAIYCFLLGIGVILSQIYA